MNLSKLLNQFSGQSGGGLQNIQNKIPGGLAGGALAGGVVATLLGSKSVRKTAGKAATYGGAAVLGGLAFNAYKNWQQNKSTAAGHNSGAESSMTSHFNRSIPNFEQEALDHSNGIEANQTFQMVLLKAMIAAARSDGSIDEKEQAKISESIDALQLEPAAKSELLELFIKPIAMGDIVNGAVTMEQKAEVYLASCLAIDLDHHAEYTHLSNLSAALGLPEGLEQELRAQAAQSA